jgi:hypothetical protein
MFAGAVDSYKHTALTTSNVVQAVSKELNRLMMAMDHRRRRRPLRYNFAKETFLHAVHRRSDAHP